MKIVRLLKMTKAIEFWLSSYAAKWFVRWTIVDKETKTAIGSIELFHRVADDDFDHTGVLRVDVKSEYENRDELYSIMDLIVLAAYDLSDCEVIITKVSGYTVERMEAAKKAGFVWKCVR